MRLASQPICRDLLRERYALAQERTVDAVRRRIATALAQAEASGDRAAWAARFLQLQRAGFIPAGRIAANAGSGRSATWVNCFVEPIEGGVPGRANDDDAALAAALAETLETLRQGGGVGLDFSPLRPQDAAAAGGAATRSGPVGALHRFDAACRQLDDAGERQGALMGVLRCDHPDIEAFIMAKARGGLGHFNLSVGLTDAFMQAHEADREIELTHRAEPAPALRAADARPGADGRWVYRRVPARRVWDRLVRAAHGQGEPGLLFLDRINRDNNLGYCESLSATNPCGEQPLPPYGACCLGSFDLTRFVDAPFEAAARFDLARLASLVPQAVRLLDNVLDLSPWPLPQQRQQALAKRRIGLGCTGLGDALVMLGLHYGSAAARLLAARIMRCLRDSSYAASTELALQRGAFTLFDADGLLRPGSFASRLPAALRQRIRQGGLRNSHLLCIAPAGSVSLAFADNVSSGIEPALAWRTSRTCAGRRGPAGRDREVEDHAARLFHRLHGSATPLPPAFVAARQLSVRQHLAMVSALQPYVDGAISKTVNAPQACTPQDIDALLLLAWRRGLKGVTVFRPDGVLGSALQPCPVPGGKVPPC